MPAPRETLVSIFCEAVAANPSGPALVVPDDALAPSPSTGEGRGEGEKAPARAGDRQPQASDGGKRAFRALSWADLAREVRRVAVVLRRLGVEPGDRVVQVSPNRYEWILVDLAVHLVRGVHVALHATLAGPQILWQIRDCGARLVFLAGAEQAVKLTAIDGACDGLKLVAYDTIENHSGTPSIQRLTELLAGIDGDDRAAIARQTAAEAQTTPECLATILYTSGTTGEPKGVMLSHGNLASNARASSGVFEQLPDDLRLCWLPLSHIFARTSDLYSWLVSRSQLALAESREQIIASCRALHPTILTGVPYFFDKLRRHLLAQPDGESPGRLTEMLGGRIRFCCSGGAALPNATAEFFWRHGVPLVQGYGLTESSPVITVSHPQANRVGAVGRAIPGVEIRIADDGEILTHGPHVMQGYWHRPQETAATIRDGWLRTGDLGRIDDDGYLWITGRKKELIVTAGGKNIAPVYLESLLAEEPLISQVAVLGEGRNYLSALIVPNAEALRAEIMRQRIPVRSAAEALVDPDVLSLYRRRIDERLASEAQCEQIGRFALLDRAFTIEQGELTPTLKLRRGVIQEHFSDRIEKLYAD